MIRTTEQHEDRRNLARVRCDAPTAVAGQTVTDEASAPSGRALGDGARTMNPLPGVASRCTAVSYRSSPDGKPTNPYPGRVEDHDSSSGEIRLYCGMVGERKAAKVRGTTIGHVAKENDGWPFRLPQSEKRAEIRVFRDQRPILPRRQLEEHRIAGRLKPEIPDM